jgi:hypothetical protein
MVTDSFISAALRRSGRSPAKAKPKGKSKADDEPLGRIPSKRATGLSMYTLSVSSLTSDLAAEKFSTLFEDDEDDADPLPVQIQARQTRASAKVVGRLPLPAPSSPLSSLHVYSRSTSEIILMDEARERIAEARKYRQTVERQLPPAIIPLVKRPTTKNQGKQKAAPNYYQDVYGDSETGNQDHNPKLPSRSRTTIPEFPVSKTPQIFPEQRIPGGQSAAAHPLLPVSRAQSVAPRHPQPVSRAQSVVPHPPQPLPRGQSVAPRHPQPVSRAQSVVPHPPQPLPRGRLVAPHPLLPVSRAQSVAARPLQPVSRGLSVVPRPLPPKPRRQAAASHSEQAAVAVHGIILSSPTVIPETPLAPSRATRKQPDPRYVEPDEDDGLLNSDGGSPQNEGYGEDLDDVDDQRENPGKVSDLRGRGLYSRSEYTDLLLLQVLMMSNQIVMIDHMRLRMRLLSLALSFKNVVSGVMID